MATWEYQLIFYSYMLRSHAIPNNLLFSYTHKTLLIRKKGSDSVFKAFDIVGSFKLMLNTKNKVTLDNS